MTQEAALDSLPAGLLDALRGLIQQGRQQALRAVDMVQVQTCWEIGRHIVEFEQGGEARAAYGKKLIPQLASTLSREFGKGFDDRNLRNMRAFYSDFPIWNAVRTELSWTHYRNLLRVSDPRARQWYMNEAAVQNWSSRALDRQIDTLYFERLLLSGDKLGVAAEANTNVAALPQTPREFVRDPVMLEFLGLPGTGKLLERKLEQALMDKLQSFLLELGKGFAFVARQQRIGMQFNGKITLRDGPNPPILRSSDGGVKGMFLLLNSRNFRAPLVLAALLCSMQLARADMWIFVDQRGVKHYASNQVDPRYKPLLGSMPDPTGPIVSGGAQIDSHLAATSASMRSITAMEISPGFRAVKQHVRSAADANQLDFALLQAVIATESGFDARAVSPKGAMGLMQVMPATAERYGVTNDKAGTVSAKLTDPKTNIHTGARYLRDLVNLFPGQLELAVAAYNAGEGAVQRAGNKIPNYKETQNYVQTVMQLYKRLSPPAQRQQISVLRGRVHAEFRGPTDAAQTEILN